MRVTAFIGSARKKHSYQAAESFLQNLAAKGDVQYEIIQLSDYKLKICKGCKLCVDKGEELCPLKDDRDLLISKMDQSDGVVFVSPNYSFQVSAQMKIFLDRLAYICHRPRFFGKTFTSIVAQGIYGGDKIVQYLDFLSKPMGFTGVKGSCITTLEPITQKGQKAIANTLTKHSQRFYAQLSKKDYPKVTLFDLMMFRISRTRIRIMLDEKFRDFIYYKNQSWFNSDFFYPTRLNPVKKLFGNFFDWMMAKMLKAEGLE